jgi:hypothetical protein
MSTPRYVLALYPRKHFGGMTPPDPMFFDTLEDAHAELRRHLDCGFEIRDHDDEERIVDQNY